MLRRRLHQRNGGIAGRRDSGTRRWSSAATVEDSARCEGGGIDSCHPDEAGADLQLGLADAGVPAMCAQ